MKPSTRNSLSFLAVAVILCALTFVPVAIDLDSDITKIITTVFGIIIFALITYRIFTVHVIPILNQEFDNPQATNLFSFMTLNVAWIVAWAVIYTIIWVWEPHFFVDHHVADATDVYDAFRYMLAGSIGIYVSDSTAHTDFANSWIAIVAGIQGIVSFFFVIGVIALILPSVLENFKRYNPPSKHPRSPKVSFLTTDEDSTDYE